MINATQTTIAQLLYLDAPPMNFARLVADLDAVIDRLPGVARTLTWDCEDVAIFQAGSLRLLLAITDAPGTDYAACLTITSGPAMANATPSPLLRRADQLCRLIERQLATTTHPDATFWHRTPRVATADLVDTLVWSLADADLVAWAMPTETEVPVRPAPPVQPMFMAPPLPAHRNPPRMPWGLFGLARTRMTTTRSLAIAGVVIVSSGPHWLPLI